MVPPAANSPSVENLAPDLRHALDQAGCRFTRQREAVYENRVFFVRNLGFVTPTEARRISFEETLRFERIHEETYRHFGFELIPIEPASVAERVRLIAAIVR